MVAPADGAEDRAEPPEASAARLAAVLGRVAELRDPDHPADDALLVRLLDSFCAQGPATLALLGQAISDDDAEAVQHLAHSAQGSAHNLGATALGRLYEKLEAQGRAGRLDKAGEVLRSAEREVVLVRHLMTATATELQAAVCAIQVTGRRW